jgi:hypothetical protein
MLFPPATPAQSSGKGSSSSSHVQKAIPINKSSAEVRLIISSIPLFYPNMQLCYQYLNYSNYYILGIKTTILMLYTPIYSGPATLCFEKQEGRR